MERRTVITRSLQTVGGLSVGIFAGPSLITALSPLIRSKPEDAWRDIGAAEHFPIGRTLKTTVKMSEGSQLAALDKFVYVRRESEGDFVVFSPSCTDLGCPVNWDQASECFFCPCHGGIFAKDGEPMAGPPKKPLYRYEFRLRDGRLAIDLHSVPAHI